MAIAAIGGLVVSLVTGQGDALATVALVLAVVAFGLQIVFFALQLWVASEQDRRSADLYRDTNALLTNIDARSEATVEVIKEQFGFVLRHALTGVNASVPDTGQPLPEASVDDSTGEDEQTHGADEDRTGADDGAVQRETRRAELAELNEKLDALTQALGAGTGTELLSRWDAISHPPPRTPPPPARGERLQKTLAKWPPEEKGREALELLKALPENALREFARIARETSSRAKEGADSNYFTAPKDRAALDALLDAKLLVRRRERRGGKLQNRLFMPNHPGVSAARLLTAEGRIPEWVNSEELSRLEVPDEASPANAARERHEQPDT